ncbi:MULTISPECIES: lipoyl synthase [Psychrilyobacter]|uniref:Lipoyl synthase n=1 Tax=Psychrilyobacter piezotolerans TaxID=2293438 RepID=A0ABX9KIE1_9FUSO|nr:MULTISPECIES: lipoyl synthase [Psychrilyobacter]MCS5422867.1 lipoyl synthase [Psychrilyobacter sp. S5]NDI77556.1 lipoyl synthase [Psychrilyobacter piezotolerans]RDE62933.1 lipoyl synthase [Psychrilyobacter sp. S5]REI41691.1 lipoyl synthase [Psychrilyobacter piezotolerans]
MDKPGWISKKFYKDNEMEKLLDENLLNTVCEAANCPNKWECFRKKTATFMILGNKCTRACRFCSVDKNIRGENLNSNEPVKIAEVVKKIRLKHVVITSVTRDDLEDEGAIHFKRTIEEIRRISDATIEVLIPDFNGKKELIDIVIDAKPEVISHNIETVENLHKRIKPIGSYENSIELLNYVKERDKNIITKSGIMLGFGESIDELAESIEDLKDINCDILTMGQYLRPSEKHIKVSEYITDEKFVMYKKLALEIGIPVVESGRFIRSSYNAIDSIKKLMK